MFVRNAAASLTIAVFVYPLSEELGWSRTTISVAAALGGLAATFVSPIVGYFIDRYGARKVLTASVLILGISTLALARATATFTAFGFVIPWAFWIAYAVGRVIFSSPVQIGAAVVVSRWFIRLRGRTNGILNLSHSVGMVLFPLIASIVIAQSGWRDAWFVLGVLVFVAALLPVSILISERPEDLGLRPDGDSGEPAADPDGTAQEVQAHEPEEPDWTTKEAVRTPTLWLLALATGLLFLMQAGTNTHSAAFFRDQGLGALIAGVGISFNAIFLGVGSIVWGRIVEKVPVRFVMAAVALVMAIASFLFTTTNTAAEALAYSALFGFGLGGMLTLPPVAYADYYGRRSLGTIRGITEPFTTFGQTVGVMIPGIVFDGIMIPGVVFDFIPSIIFDFISSGSYMPFFFAAGSVGILTALISLFATQPRHSSTVEHP